MSRIEKYKTKLKEEQIKLTDIQDIINYDEYIIYKFGASEVSITHKGNCDNLIHK
jgi:hypothetical protein